MCEKLSITSFCKLRGKSKECLHTQGKDEENFKEVGKGMYSLYLCFIINFVAFSQDLINQGREKVVEATNSVTAARIQPLEDIISTIVGEMGDCGVRSGGDKRLNNIRQRNYYCMWSFSRLIILLMKILSSLYLPLSLQLALTLDSIEIRESQS